MEKLKRELTQIKDDIKIINSNKLSISQSKLLFMGIVYEIILSKELFPRNKDLKGFINNLFITRFEKKEYFKDYLYDSRTLLAARVQRKIYYDLEYNQIIEIINEIYNILPDSEENNRNSKKNNNAEEELNEWMSFIRDKG